MIKMSFAAVAAVLALIPGGAAGAHAGGAKPTIVLVHGAFADSSGFNAVAARLLRDGYPVVAAPNPLRGLGSDAAAVRALLDSIQGPIVLVGHSYGGAVISAAATGDTDVRALVYLAAFVPEAGRACRSWPGGSRAARSESRSRRCRCPAVRSTSTSTRRCSGPTSAAICPEKTLHCWRSRSGRPPVPRSVSPPQARRRGTPFRVTT
ncbi:alpha/beta fold hydrolase [Paractinoplanes durhamensis]|uniref:alpha/beta fold hydrolase n=1 Tax=Paractinoplanes durhamensis TaxID=113563 RepID=UPI0036409148